MGYSTHSAIWGVAGMWVGMAATAEAGATATVEEAGVMAEAATESVQPADRLRQIRIRKAGQSRHRPHTRAAGRAPDPRRAGPGGGLLAFSFSPGLPRAHRRDPLRLYPAAADREGGGRARCEWGNQRPRGGPRSWLLLRRHLRPGLPRPLRHERERMAAGWGGALAGAAPSQDEQTGSQGRQSIRPASARYSSHPHP